MNESDRVHTGREERITDADSGVEPPAERVDVEHKRLRAVRFGLTDRTAHKRNRRGIDRPMQLNEDDRDALVGAGDRRPRTKSKRARDEKREEERDPDRTATQPHARLRSREHEALVASSAPAGTRGATLIVHSFRRSACAPASRLERGRETERNAWGGSGSSVGGGWLVCAGTTIR